MDCKVLPVGKCPKALNFDHFPTRYQAVIWRNWNLVPVERLAEVLNATATQIEEAGKSMGLEKELSLCDLWMRRGYLTIIRRNWHLLPYEQLTQLLGWSVERMAFTLKEEDFLWSKMGSLKPAAEPVKYAPLTDSQKQSTERLRERLAHHMMGEPTLQAKPFDFLDFKPQGTAAAGKPDRQNLRLVYSYSALYGDPLLNPDLDPYPEALLNSYAECGINAVWLQGTLYTLIPWAGESDYSQNWRRRLKNLRALAIRCARHGIGLYLYMNEPRGMPENFFVTRPDWQGCEYKENFAFCTSSSGVLEALASGLKQLFSEVPELAGVFTITMSENLTHCRSHSGKTTCPRCARRNPETIVAEINGAIERGVHAAKPAAEVIAWSWGWQYPWDEKVVRMLPENVKLMCVSETDLETESGGVKGRVADYAISKVGPGPTARRLWRAARRRGLDIVAKVQLNNTWECSAVPYIPTPGLVARHLENLNNEGISDFMAGWTLGGWPDGNLQLLNRSPRVLAKTDFGMEAAPEIIQALEKFDRAFEHFPLNSTSQLYRGPQNYGPANLLFKSPTNYEATMLGFPYDDLYTWRGMGHYPEELFEEQFRKLSEGWKEGLDILAQTKSKVSPLKKSEFTNLFNVAEAVYCHFRSSYLQICFIRWRGLKNRQKKIADLLDEEILLAKRLLKVVCRDSRIGFEASNHYYYTVNDLQEKVLNCEYLKANLDS